MTKLWRGPFPVVLASKSAARRSLLAASGIPFEIFEAKIDERGMETPLLAAGATAGEIALHLARAKALFVSAKMRERLVIGADQTLCLENRLLTKAADKAALVATLEALSGRDHELHSACCIARANTVLFETVLIARLTCRRLSRAFIEAYVAEAGEALLASVGGYQMEGLGIQLFEVIEGDHATILGLPLLPLLKFLREEGSLLS
ncbi:septum formation inhibitor Maf [Beijerinckiaceae bacterium]|nr:septum formation inhibitor Maf [Beijerinckiaceae bacterium]